METRSSSVRGFSVIVGVGTDIVEIVRIGRMVERHGEHFLQRVFTTDEIKYCQRRRESNQHYAGRWAAKEAIMKALGTGFIRGISWLDIEIRSRRSGQPEVLLSGGARERAELIGIDQILITISHCRSYATATAIGVGKMNPTAIPANGPSGPNTDKPDQTA